jgi:hypothetical protein
VGGVAEAAGEEDQAGGRGERIEAEPALANQPDEDQSRDHEVASSDDAIGGYGGLKRWRQPGPTLLSVTAQYIRLPPQLLTEISLSAHQIWSDLGQTGHRSSRLLLASRVTRSA